MPERGAWAICTTMLGLCAGLLVALLLTPPPSSPGWSGAGSIPTPPTGVSAAMSGSTPFSPPSVVPFPPTLPAADLEALAIPAVARAMATESARLAPTHAAGLIRTANLMVGAEARRAVATARAGPGTATASAPSPAPSPPPDTGWSAPTPAPVPARSREGG